MPRAPWGLLLFLWLKGRRWTARNLWPIYSKSLKNDSHPHLRPHFMLSRWAIILHMWNPLIAYILFLFYLKLLPTDSTWEPSMLFGWTNFIWEIPSMPTFWICLVWNFCPLTPRESLPWYSSNQERFVMQNGTSCSTMNKMRGIMWGQNDSHNFPFAERNSMGRCSDET